MIKLSGSLLHFLNFVYYESTGDGESKAAFVRIIREYQLTVLGSTKPVGVIRLRFCFAFYVNFLTIHVFSLRFSSVA